MYYFQIETAKALGDELHRQASVHRITPNQAGERAGPIGWFRHRAGHALIAVGQTVAHGGQASAHLAHEQRPID
jgi:hypothetical protein